MKYSVRAGKDSCVDIGRPLVLRCRNIGVSAFLLFSIFPPEADQRRRADLFQRVT